MCKKKIEWKKRDNYWKFKNGSRKLKANWKRNYEVNGKKKIMGEKMMAVERAGNLGVRKKKTLWRVRWKTLY